MQFLKGKKWGINLQSVHCPQCNKQAPKIRTPKNLRQLLWGGWTCSECGCKMDKWGKSIVEKH